MDLQSNDVRPLTTRPGSNFKGHWIPGEIVHYKKTLPRVQIVPIELGAKPLHALPNWVGTLLQEHTYLLVLHFDVLGVSPESGVGKSPGFRHVNRKTDGPIH